MTSDEALLIVLSAWHDLRNSGSYISEPVNALSSANLKEIDKYVSELAAQTASKPNGASMIRARFRVTSSDFRPIVWPISHPYWCTGFGPGYSILVAYADGLDQIRECWPDATHITWDSADGYVFTDRFPRPDWLKS